jgi:hypothetical protein
MSEARTIKPKSIREFPEYLDFEFLRREGIGHIQELAGALWTDHNVHDPGITILEVLCYALTDLGYRSNLDIRELLACPPDKTGPDDNFFTAADILTNNPLTILDYRKLLIDIDGVRNAWLRPLSLPEDKPQVPVYFSRDAEKLSYTSTGQDGKVLLDLNGLYKVYIELDNDVLTGATDACGNAIDKTGDVLAEVKRRLHRHRNLCEDFIDIIVLSDERIGLCGDIELKADAFPDDVMLRILETIRAFLSPTLPFYTLKQMLEKGKTTDEIFEGRPLLSESHGFIDPEELKKLNQREEIHVSDLYALILNIEGVSAIKKLSIYNHTFDSFEGQDWVMELHPQAYRPILAEEESLQGITFYKRGIPYSANANQVRAKLKKKLSNPFKVLKKANDLNLSLPKGEYRPDLGDYYSIQNDFPLVYGIGEDGLPQKTTTRKRQAQAWQLKGYLLFFDRLLTNYAAQLANIRSLFSTQLDETSASFITGSLDSVPHLAKLLPSTEGGDMGYMTGENIAVLSDPTFYKTPQARNHALDLVIESFDNQTIVVEVVLDEAGRASLLLKSTFGRTIILKSVKSFNTEKEALEAIEKVRFLATLRESYTLLDKSDAREYGFALVYNPTNYNAYLKNIIESPEDFYARKNQFFDHLLRRFAEDFTDYTLLTFALNKKDGQLISATDFARRFAQDKSAFLRDYPDISRNRGKAFDYLNKESVWEGDNISGVERRVMRLIGVKERATKKINYFDIAPYTPQFYYEYRAYDATSIDGSARTLLRSRVGYDSIEAAKKACMEMKHLAQNPQNFLVEKCAVECVYTFKIKDENGCIIAVHPESFGSATLRDERRTEVQNILTHDGLIRTFEAHIQGFIFKIKKEDKVLLESPATLPLERDAHIQYHRCIKAAVDERLYYDIDDRFGLGFSFEIRVSTEGGAIVLGRHPHYYADSEVRDKVKEECRQYMSRYQLRIVTEQLPQRYGWQLTGVNNIVLLKSIHLFKKKKQTAAAFYQALINTQDNLLIIKKQNLSGKWTFSLMQRQYYPIEMPDGSITEGVIDIPIAENPYYFVTENACNATISMVQELAQTILNNPQLEPLFHSEDYLGMSAESIWALFTSDNGSGSLMTIPGQFITYLKDKEGDTIWLAAEAQYDTLEDSLIAFDTVLRSACAGSFKEFEDNGGCAYGFELLDTMGKRLAFHPVLYTDRNSRSLMLQYIKKTVCAHIFDFKIEEITSAYRAELRWNTCDGKTAVILRGVEKRTEEEKARQDFDAVINAIRSGLGNVGIEKNNEKPFAFWVKMADGARAAESVVEYETAAERDVALDKIIDYIQWNTIYPDCHIEVVEICDCELSDKTKLTEHPYTWRVWDDEEVLARHFDTFSSEVEALNCARTLARGYVCCPPVYSTVWLYRNNFERDEKNNFYFILRDDTAIYWRSAAVYPSVDEAQKAFDALYVFILNTAKNPDAYVVCPIKNDRIVIELIDSETGVKIAESYHTLFTAAEVAAETEVLLNQAFLFPIIPIGDKWTFRFYEPEQDGWAWESHLIFNTTTEAWKGLQRLLDVLTYTGSYRAVCDNCGWRLEIIEVLLESQPFYTSANKIKANIDYAWERVEHFLDDYGRLGAQMIDNFTDYNTCCSYGFRFVGENYRVATLNRAYHSSCERATDRDTLYQLFKCHINIWRDYASNPVLKDWSARQNTAAYSVEKKEWTCTVRDKEGKEVLPKIKKDVFIPYFLLTSGEKAFLTEGGYDTQAEAELVIQTRLTALQTALPLMRYIENFLVFTDIKNNKTVYLLGIADFDGQLIYTFDEPVKTKDTWYFRHTLFDTEEAVINTIRAYHTSANTMPFVMDNTGKIRFEIRVQNETEKRGVNGLIDQYCDLKIFEFPVYITLLESIRAYSSMAQAQAAFKSFIKLLQDKEAYTHAEFADGSLTLNITDAEQIVAVHPRTYNTLAERQAALQLTLDRINTEGIHLIEHILLRPRSEEDRLMRVFIPEKDPVQPTPTQYDIDKAFFDYTMGADPYSFQTTVILPYWARRFRNNDFRAFFENTIRRESPAPVFPYILWIKPQQMQLFEKHFRCWLMNVGRSDCLDKMIGILEDLKNVFIDAYVLDCESGANNDNIILLNKTPLN